MKRSTTARSPPKGSREQDLSRSFVALSELQGGRRCDGVAHSDRPTEFSEEEFWLYKSASGNLLSLLCERFGPTSHSCRLQRNGSYIPGTSAISGAGAHTVEIFTTPKAGDATKMTLMVKIDGVTNYPRGSGQRLRRCGADRVHRI